MCVFVRAHTYLYPGQQQGSAYYFIQGTKFSNCTRLCISSGKPGVTNTSIVPHTNVVFIIALCFVCLYFVQVKLAIGIDEEGIQMMIN